MFNIIRDWFAAQGVPAGWVEYAAWATTILTVMVLALLANFVARRLLVGVVGALIEKSRTKWDDALLKRRVLHRAAHAAPALVYYWLAAAFPPVEGLIERLAMVYMLVVGGLTVSAILNTIVDVYQSLGIERNRPIKGFVQLGQIILAAVVVIVGLAVLFDESPLGLLGGLGAMTAVLMLVFKDTILSLVASFQISSSNMIRRGDWIEMPKYGADGDVIDISLYTIKVQNWNKTISSIPTSAFISESFKNWRGMNESGGRRIKRAINIDMNSIEFCDAAMIDRFKRFDYISKYISDKQKELAEYNAKQTVDVNYLVNGRHLTNIGTFRTYVLAYLKNHPKIHQSMTFLVRQLPPGEHGLPLEIYVFSSVQAWAEYEAIQADIFDHLLAVLPLFDLRVFQRPGGRDFSTLAGAHPSS
jgi:miniconductance mechanosensitive channel